MHLLWRSPGTYLETGVNVNPSLWPGHAGVRGKEIADGWLWQHQWWLQLSDALTTGLLQLPDALIAGLLHTDLEPHLRSVIMSWSPDKQCPGSRFFMSPRAMSGGWAMISYPHCRAWAIKPELSFVHSTASHITDPVSDQFLCYMPVCMWHAHARNVSQYCAVTMTYSTPACINDFILMCKTYLSAHSCKHLRNQHFQSDPTNFNRSVLLF